MIVKRISCFPAFVSIGPFGLAAKDANGSRKFAVNQNFGRMLMKFVSGSYVSDCVLGTYGVDRHEFRLISQVSLKKCYVTFL